jgi:uncharacterized membrane protein HdeD (DUF308 family)
MPLFILFVGILLVVVGVNNKIPELTELLKEDFKPSGNTPAFQVWILAIFVAGSLGYIRAFKPVANAFLTLIIIALLLSNRGFFDKFSNALEGKSL